jgi:Spy/CpxP family protein refolding chaperone
MTTHNNASTTGRATSRKILALGAVLALVVAGTLWAQQGPRGDRGRPGFGAAGHGPGRGGMHRFEALADYLELTAEQRDAWQAAHEAHKADIEPLFEQLRANHDALRSATESEDALAIGNAILAAQDLRGELESAHESLQADLVALLTAEQRDRYEALEAARELRGPRGARRGPGRGPRGPGPRGDA